MAVDFTVRSATNTVVERLTFAHIDVTGAEDNTAAGAERRYYLKATLAGQDPLRSHVFSPSQDGKHTWDDVMFPAAGSWTLAMHDVLDDSVVHSESVTVSAQS